MGQEGLEHLVAVQNTKGMHTPHVLMECLAHPTCSMNVLSGCDKQSWSFIKEALILAVRRSLRNSEVGRDIGSGDWGALRTRVSGSDQRKT